MHPSKVHDTWPAHDLENARVPQSEAAQVIGHDRAGITFGTYNPEGMALKALREVVEKIGYKGLRAW